MKHIILLIAAVLASGCEPDGKPRQSPHGLDVSVDAETGCEYVRQGSGGLTPRIDRDGKTHRGCGA